MTVLDDGGVSLRLNLSLLCFPIHCQISSSYKQEEGRVNPRAEGYSLGPPIENINPSWLSFVKNHLRYLGCCDVSWLSSTTCP